MEAIVVKTPKVEATYRISEMLRSVQGQDGAVLLDLCQGRMFSVNPVGSRILALMKEDNSESEIVDLVSQEFEVNREIAVKDVRRFLCTLVQHKLVQASPNCTQL